MFDRIFWAGAIVLTLPLTMLVMLACIEWLIGKIRGRPYLLFGAPGRND